MTTTRTTFNFSLSGELDVDANKAVFDLDEIGEWEAWIEMIRERQIGLLMTSFDGFANAIPGGVPVFFRSSGRKPRSFDAAIIAERPDDYFAHVGGDRSEPSSDEIHVAPGVRLTLPDAFLYVAFEFAEDDAIRQNIINAADDMVDRGWPPTRDLSGMRLPKGFMKLRADIEASAMQNGVGGGSPSAVAASI